MFKFILDLFRKKGNNGSKRPPLPVCSVSQNKSTFLPHIDQKTELKITIETKEIDAEFVLADGCDITKLYLDGYKCPSGGYLNWAIYKVVGKNQATGRRKTMQIEAKTEAAAIQIAEANGIIAPHEITAIPHELPTENQIQYLRSFKSTVPEGATKVDVSTILSRLADSHDFVSEKEISSNERLICIRPLPSPSEEFAKFADDVGVKFSRYIGQDALFGSTINHLDGTDRLEFYAYCILCYQKNSEVGDMRKSAYYDQIKTFAKETISNDAVVRSIFGRTPNDYLHPHKGTVAYKAVAEFFKI